MATEAEAIEAVREFIEVSRVTPWEEQTVKVTPGEVDGRNAWIVEAHYALAPGEELWMYFLCQPNRYYVDRETGRFLGFGTGSAKTIFKGDEWRNPRIRRAGDLTQS